MRGSDVSRTQTVSVGKTTCLVLSSTSQRPIFTKFGHKRESMSTQNVSEAIFENFQFRGHLPPKLQN